MNNADQLPATVIEARRPGPRAWLTMILCEGRMVARDTAGLVVPIGLPLLILVMSASSAGEQAAVNGRTGLDVFVIPLVFTIVMALIGVVNMPSFLALYRRTGILRRLAVTPASPFMVLAAQAVVSVLQTAVGVAAALAVAVAAFGARLPARPVAALGVVLLAMAAMYATGMVVAAVAPTPNSAVAIGLVAFFAFGALGGLFGGRDALPDALATLGGLLPFGATVEALSAAWAGVAIDPAHPLSLAVAVAAGAAVSVAFFRWD
jgi:ABC-2 type transport system permease protein